MSDASYTQVTGKLINRQDAIEACESISRSAIIEDGEPLVRKSAVKYVLENLPSAEPKIKCVAKVTLSQEQIQDAVDEAVEKMKADLIAKIQIGINATNTNDSYSCGMRNGMRLCMSLIDDKEPLFENCPSVEPEQKCKSCRYRNLEWYEEPCDSCTMGGEGCHYKPERKKV